MYLAHSGAVTGFGTTNLFASGAVTVFIDRPEVCPELGRLERDRPRVLHEERAPKSSSTRKERQVKKEGFQENLGYPQ